MKRNSRNRSTGLIKNKSKESQFQGMSLFLVLINRSDRIGSRGVSDQTESKRRIRYQEFSRLYSHFEHALSRRCVDVPVFANRSTRSMSPWYVFRHDLPVRVFYHFNTVKWAKCAQLFFRLFYLQTKTFLKTTFFDLSHRYAVQVL